jgi:hypothetical protein
MNFTGDSQIEQGSASEMPAYSDDVINNIVKNVLEHESNMGNQLEFGTNRWIRGLIRGISRLQQIAAGSERQKIADQFQRSYLTPEILKSLKSRMTDEEFRSLETMAGTPDTDRFPEMQPIYESIINFTKLD